jgi:signal transduction histidine kinase
LLLAAALMTPVSVLDVNDLAHTTELQLPGRPGQVAITRAASSARRASAHRDIVDREPSFWRHYRTETILISLLVLLQAAAIGLLLRQRHQWRQAHRQGERERLELMYASRLAMGRELSASIAHELSQPLSTIHLNASVGEDMIEQGNPSLTELKEILGDIRRSGERAGEIIKKMRGMSQKRPIEMRSIDINEVLSGVLQFLRAAADHRELLLEADFAAGLPAVRADRMQLQQVIMNLVMNGLESMAGNPPDRQTLTLRTRMHSEGWIEVSVIDAGHGIAPELMTRVFDPFFSTRRDGLGLGLSISRSIVLTHGGRIWAESNGAGTTFNFVFPAAD